MAGRGARYGHDSMIAAEMAAEEINAAGGVLGRQVRLLFADDRSDPTYAVRMAIRYIREDLVDFLMGVISSAVGLAVTQVSRQSQVIFVGTDHASTALTLESFQPYYFRVSNNTMQSMRAGAIYSSQRPWATYLYIGPDYEYGHRQWQDFRTFLASLRPDVRFLGALWPKLFEPDYSPYLQAIRREKPEVLVHGFWGGDAIAFTRQALAHGLFDTVPVVSFDAGGNYEVFEALGEEMPEGLVLGARHHNNFPDTELNRRYVRAFHARASRYPCYAAHGAYVGVQFIARAAEKAGLVGEPREFIQAAEGLALRNPKDRDGFTSWMRPLDHQMVQEQAIGISQRDSGFPPARCMLSQWTVLGTDKILPTEEEVRALRRQAAIR
jgi:branched-chain amino acid transport system substrate-binding protein